MAQGITERSVAVVPIFTPSLDNTQRTSITLSAASARVALPASPNDPNKFVSVVMLYSDITCYIRFTTVSGVAVTTDFPVPLQTLVPLGVPPGATNIAAIAAGAGTLQIHGLSG
jgi:hypothetical protein